MTMDFLTTEDVNTVSYNNQGFYWHEIDTSLISGTEDFTDVKYDFCEVSREYRGSAYYYPYEFTFKIYANNWSLAYYTNYGHNIIRESETQLKIQVNYPSIKIRFYMGNLKLNRQTNMLVLLKDERLILNCKELYENQLIYYKSPSATSYSSESKSVSLGYNEIKVHNNNWFAGFLLVELLKTNFQFQCTQSLVIGKVNKVYLGTDDDYLPDGDMVGSYTPIISVDYNGETLPVSYDGTDYYFNLDLTPLTEPKNIRFTVKVEANEVLNNSETLVKLVSDYPTVNTFSALQSACKSNGIIRLGSNITFENRISISNGIKIIGNDKTLDLNGYGFDLNEDVNLTMENIFLANGDTAIKQAKNTKLELTNVSFTGCQSSNHSNLGACILCDIDYPSLSVEDDFQTDLTNCLFTNNHSTILHGGELNINNCKFHNTDTDYVDKSNTAFIYQTDGDCTILNSVFDIDYDDDYSLCIDEVNIGYAQTIFMCGETATINRLTYLDLKSNNFRSFFDGLENNRSHILAKYYYPQITNCVFISPTQGNEDKAFCYSLSSDDMIYKVNSQVTRSSWNTENTQRVILW